jgi:hypothetical protein
MKEPVKAFFLHMEGGKGQRCDPSDGPVSYMAMDPQGIRHAAFGLSAAGKKGQAAVRVFRKPEMQSFLCIIRKSVFHNFYLQPVYMGICSSIRS